MSLKEKTIQGLSWSFADRFINQIVQFGIGIILARLLSPEEYGLTGMLAIFLGIADTFIVTGFTEALMQKKDANPLDYATVFWTNVITGVFFYALFCLSAQQIGLFFNQPLLIQLIVVLGFTTIINALGQVPRVTLLLQMDFKSFTIMSVVSNTVSGLAAVALAFAGYGVWSLVWRSLLQSIINTLMVFIIVKPRYPLQFSYHSFKDFFGFGSKLLLSRLIDELYMNGIHVIIGKFYNARELGLYTRANNYKDLPSRILNSILISVSYPALIAIKDDNPRLKNAYRKLLQSSTYIIFVLMVGMAAAAKNFILGLIGTKWLEAVPYLQLLCIIGMLSTLRYLNLTLLTLKGRSDIYLRLEIITKILTLPAILIGIFYGVKIMIIGLIISALLDYYLIATQAGRQIHYTLLEQIKDFTPTLAFAIMMGLLVYITGEWVQLAPFPTLLIQCLVGGIATLFFSNYFNIKPYIEIRQIILNKLRPSAT